MYRPIVQHLTNVICLLAIAVLASGSLIACDDETDKQVLVRVYERATQSQVGILVSEDAQEITIRDLKTGKRTSIPKTKTLTIINPLSLNAAARTAGLSTIVGWKLKQLAGRKKSIGKIASVTSQVVYITLGESAGLRVGQLLSVYRNDGDIVNPDTGEVLGSQRARIAQLEVVEVNSKLSKTKLKGTDGFEVALRIGDEVEPSSTELVVAVCPIFDENGTLTTVGAGIAEDLTTNLVQQKVSVVERSVIGSALNELLVQNTILFDESSSQKLGKLTGANFVLTGKIVPKNKSGTVYVRLINVETGKILFAISTSVRLTNAKIVKYSVPATLVVPMRDNKNQETPKVVIVPATKQHSAEPEIVSAIFGSGRSAVHCEKQVELIIQNRKATTVISTPGLGLRNRAGSFRDALRITYRLDGREGLLVLGNDKHTNIYKAILEDAAKKRK